MNINEARKVLPAVWVIYCRPKDHPEHFVVRKWYGEVCEKRVALLGNLEAARFFVRDEGACVNLGRSSTDDPVIAEVWI